MADLPGRLQLVHHAEQFGPIKDPIYCLGRNTKMN
jgi:hypothetical protein